MNRLLAKLRPLDQPDAQSADGIRHVRLVAGDEAAPAPSYVLSTAETAPCTCPDFCERDHDNE
jgi:hypothetical protein